MADEPGKTAALHTPGGELELTIRPATEGARLRDRQAAVEHRPRHLRPRLRQHRVVRVGDHLHRRRRGHPALPRLPDRPARRAVDVPRDQLPADLRRAADAGRSSTSSTTKIRRHTLLHEDMKRFFDGFPRDAHPMPVLSSRGLARCRPSTRTRCDPFDEDAGRALDLPAAGEAADDRGLRLQEVDRAAVPLPGQLARPRRELPADDVRLPGRAVRGRPGGRARRSTCCSSCTPTTSRTARPRRCGWSARRRRTCSRRSRPASTRCSGRCTAARTRRCCEMLEQIRDARRRRRRVRRAG